MFPRTDRRTVPGSNGGRVPHSVISRNLAVEDALRITVGRTNAAARDGVVYQVEVDPFHVFDGLAIEGGERRWVAELPLDDLPLPVAPTIAGGKVSVAGFRLYSRSSAVAR